jgi:hypothetical protein
MRLILEIVVQPAEKKPVTALDEEGKWKVYVRRKDHTLLANKILLEVWKHQKRGISRPEKIGDEESALLTLIAEGGELTLSRIYRASTLKKSQIDRLLVVFICWGLVEMDINENGTFYRTSVV